MCSVVRDLINSQDWCKSINRRNSAILYVLQRIPLRWIHRNKFTFEIDIVGTLWLDSVRKSNLEIRKQTSNYTQSPEFFLVQRDN